MEDPDEEEYFETMAENQVPDEDGLFEAMEENENFVELALKYRNSKSFLVRDEHVFARSSTASIEEQDDFLKYSSDVDGCVVEMKSWNGLKMVVKHLTVCHTPAREIKSLLKKHVDLTKFSAGQLGMFNHSVGFQLFYEQGWEGWVGVIPRTSAPTKEMPKEDYQKWSCTFFEGVRAEFQRKLFGVRDRARNTLAKNDLSDVRKLFVLPDDSSLILSEFQAAIDETPLDRHFEVIQFCFRFGEKSKEGVSLGQFHMENIKQMTVHCAINISSDTMELMWSLAGVQRVIRARGVLQTCLSFTDCVCYQSNVDGKALDVSNELRQICRHPEKLRFVQMYADNPHRRPKTRFHPVSGCIAGGMVFHKITSDAFLRDAKKYISTLDSNFSLMEKSTCRIEFVCEVKPKDVIIATDCLDVENLCLLLAKQPMLVPFPKDTSYVVRKHGLWMTTTLRSLLDKYSCTGNVEAIWRAFQLELATEKILWGYPLCFRSHVYSVSLGPGKLAPSRSVTDQLGYMALTRWSSCMATEDSIPDCDIWSRSPAMIRRIKRTVGLHDVLESSPTVLGRKLLHALITDLFEAGNAGGHLLYEHFQQDLYSERTSHLPVHGAITGEQLVRLLSRKMRIPQSMVYGQLCKLVERSGHELRTILASGLPEVRLKHFPAIQNYDKDGNPVLTWTWRSGLVKIVTSAETAKPSPQVLSQLVKGQLECRNLVYASRLKTAAPNSFPWIEACIRKLEGENLNTDKLVEVLCFISCVAFIMNGWYVEYQQLEKLMQDLEIKQFRLRALEIQSKLIVANFNKFKLFRLHHTIPCKLTVEKTQEIQRKKEDDKPINDSEEAVVEECNPNIIPDETETKSSTIVLRNPTSLPLIRGEKRKWDAVELEALDNVKMQKIMVLEKYQIYRDMCMSGNVPFRTFQAFRAKLNRLRQNGKGIETLLAGVEQSEV